MSSYLSETYIYDAGEYIQKAIEQLHNLVEIAEHKEDKIRVENMIYDLSLVYETLNLDE